MFKQYQWKIIFSLFIIYHCLIIFLYPNRLSYLSSVIQPYTLIYANVLGLNRPWDFFSIPGSSVYLKVYIFKEKEEIAQYLFPSKKDNYTFRPMFNRRYAAARFFVNDKSDSIEKVFIPWVCSLYIDATSISVHLMLIRTLPIKEVKVGTQVDQMKKTIEYHFITKKCASTNSVKNTNIGSS